MNPVAQAAEAAGRQVAGANEANLAEQLNQAVGKFLGWPYKIASGRAVDRQRYSRAVRLDLSTSPPRRRRRILTHFQPIPWGPVIDACETADLDMLRASYARVAQAKRLKKTPAPRTDVPNTTVTLGIIFALRSAVPLEDLAEELQRLNTGTPAREWPDMVVVANTGTINYAGQFPGDGNWAYFFRRRKGRSPISRRRYTWR